MTEKAEDKKTKTAKKAAPAKKMAKSKTAAPKAAGKMAKATKSADGSPAAKQKYVTKATLSHARISPQKARLVVDLIRGKQIEPALQILQFSPKKAAVLCTKLLRSAISNAKEHGGIDLDDLWVLGGQVDMGRTMKRWMPRAQGRATPIRKRSSHITLTVGER